MDILQELLNILETGETGMIATIISTDGSTPASALTKMIVADRGKRSVGTVGGGCMEGDVLQAVKELWDTKKAKVLTFHLNENDMIQGLICGGSLEIFLEPVTRTSAPLYRELKALRDNGDDSVVATVLSPSGEIVSKELFQSQDSAARKGAERWTGEPFTAALLRAFRRMETQKIQLPEGTLILEPVPGRPQLIIFGGGHVSRYLSRTASMAGFSVSVVDDRALYASKERFPEADATIAVEFSEALRHVSVTSLTYVVIVTRGHRADEEILEQVIATPAKYIGMIGSKRKILTTYEHLAKQGVKPEQLRRVHAPMGLEIGAATAEEIAVSVVAELIQVRRGSASPARNKSDSMFTLIEKLTPTT